jgi:hypothetical protein
MKKLILILAVCAAATMAHAGWRYSGLDGHGHWVTGRWDNNGNYSGLDGNGNWVTGHIDRNGNYSGLDGNGHWVTGHLEDDGDWGMGQWTPNY